MRHLMMFFFSQSTYIICSPSLLNMQVGLLLCLTSPVRGLPVCTNCGVSSPLAGIVDFERRSCLCWGWPFIRSAFVVADMM
ncbi:hypothetical protein DFH94DRAFT_427976 [Russula ochroleuca]|uniref:Secreted protein n=1 Tax=Russula ochroleuca TaxID=152965 RepID=A0A9P5MWY9_9AGAM|nr:hypothetical protein DFH94DRAFT_427976 [Russula ochroleuca]